MGHNIITLQWWLLHCSLSQWHTQRRTVCRKAALRALTEMFNVHWSIYWGQQKATFWKTEERAVFGLIFMNDFMLWAKRETKDNHRRSNHATKETREGNIKKIKHKARAVSLSVRVININLCLWNGKTKSGENSAGLSCLIHIFTLERGTISILLILWVIFKW